jgi:quercetin dioxygenase-like cupin family protein
MSDVLLRPSARLWRPLRSSIVLGLVAVLAGSVLAGPAPSSARAQSVSKELATHELPGVPAARRWAVRHDHPANAGSHAHAGGFLYVAAGESVVRYDDGREVALREGEAAWVAEGVAHGHQSREGTQLSTFALETAEDLEAEPPFFATAELQGFREGPHLARMVDQTYGPGESTPPHRHFGPESVYFREGRWELNYLGALTLYPAGTGYVVEPLVPHQLRNAGSEPARLFNLGLVPAGQPQGEPVPAEDLR